MILIALGANLPSRIGAPRETCIAALGALEQKGVRVGSVSRWYESAPVPLSDQPSYVNGVASVDTDLNPAGLLSILLDIEKEFGRERSEQNAARTLDLDLLAYHESKRETAPVLPHPQLQDRAFVLLPLMDVAPGWKHPRTGDSLESMISALDDPNSAISLS